MRTKRAGLGTKFVILTLLAGLVVTILSMNARLEAAQEERDALSQEIMAQEENNAALAEDIENCDDPDQIAAIAREKLGLVGQNEIVFVDKSK